MYDRQTRLRAVELYMQHRNVSEVARIMDGPSRSCVESWIAGAVGTQKKSARTRGLAVDDKMEAVERVLAGELAPAVAESIGVSPGAVYHWKARYEKMGALGLMGRQDERKPPPGQPPAGPVPEPPREGELEGLRRRCADLELELDLMKGVVEIVKKDRGADPGALSNKEKAALIDALRPTYSLTCLASRLNIPLSSYHYSRAAASAPDKYAAARRAVVEEFEGANRSRGYRYVCRRLRGRGDVAPVGERKVREIMAEEGCEVVYHRRRRRRYDSYKGEISEAPENLVGREFRAARPNALWLTDITEFKLPGDSRKVYLSPVVDCFDGGLASWSIGTSPDAALANASLRGACGRLGGGERPVCHSDRGCHYRWPGWISICEEHGIARSMSKKGCSPDNSACEGFFGRLKNEFFYYRDWSGVTAEEFMGRLDAWLRYYNEERIKESLGWRSPMQHRRALGLAA